MVRLAFLAFAVAGCCAPTPAAEPRPPLAASKPVADPKAATDAKPPPARPLPTADAESPAADRGPSPAIAPGADPAPPPVAAKPRLADAPAPCVNREDQWWRPVRDPLLDASALWYCTGADCWRLDLASNTIAPAPARPAVRPPRDRQGERTDGHGTLLASADETQVAFCPGGEGTCRVFHYKFDNRAVNGVYPTLNDERTLGAVTYRGEEENGAPSYVLLYDLVKRKPIATLKADGVAVLGHGFLIEQSDLYNAAGKKIGALAVPDQGWKRLGKTDLIALHDPQNGAFLIQDAATGKLKARIAHGLDKKDTAFVFVAAGDGATLYAIGTVSDEGEVLTIDVATARITKRATPPPCPAGTHRILQ